MSIPMLHLIAFISLHYKTESGGKKEACETDKGGHKLDLEEKLVCDGLLISNWPSEI